MTKHPRPAVTPYDTGERLEPRPWVSRERPAQGDDDFGRVDFDDEEGHTVVTIHVRRRHPGAYMVRIDNLGLEHVEVYVGHKPALSADLLDADTLTRRLLDDDPALSPGEAAEIASRTWQALIRW